MCIGITFFSMLKETLVFEWVACKSPILKSRGRLYQSVGSLSHVIIHVRLFCVVLIFHRSSRDLSIILNYHYLATALNVIHC